MVCTVVSRGENQRFYFCFIPVWEEQGGWSERNGYIWVNLLPVDVCPSLKGREACLATKGLLGGVNHVEEAIFISLLFVDLRNGGGHADHAVLIDKKEKGLGGVELQSASGKERHDN